MMPKYLTIAFFLVLAGVDLPAQWMKMGPVNTATNPNSFFTDLWMTGDGRGFRLQNLPGPTPATGITHRLYRTNDDWVTELQIFQGGGGTYGCCALHSFHFLDSLTGFMLRGDAGVYSAYKTTDGGASWTQFSGACNAAPGNMIMVNDTLGFLTALTYSQGNGAVFRITPSQFDLVLDLDSFRTQNSKMAFPEPQIGYLTMEEDDLLSNGGRILKTSDGGDNWSEVYQSAVLRFTAIASPHRDTVWAGDENGRLHLSIDGGTTWNMRDTLAGTTIHSLAFYNSKIGYAACEGGYLYRTSDAGFNWSLESLGTTADLYQLQLIDAQTAYVLGEDTLYKRIDPATDQAEASQDPRVQISVFPNPAKDGFSLKIFGARRTGPVRILDLQGRELRAIERDHFSLSGLPAGSYLLSIPTHKGVFFRRLLRQ